jgi:hypothetical protein
VSARAPRPSPRSIFVIIVVIVIGNAAACHAPMLLVGALA